MKLRDLHRRQTTRAGRRRRSLSRLLQNACRWAVIAGVVVAVGTTAVSQSGNRREIPFENSRVFGLFLIKVEVNGRPAVLIVDTGSSITAISPEFADVALGTVDVAASPAKGSGFTGLGVFRRARLKVSSVTWDHRMLVTDTRELSRSLGQRVDGILGIDFFTGFEVVVVDLKKHKLILTP